MVNKWKTIQWERCNSQYFPVNIKYEICATCKGVTDLQRVMTLQLPSSPPSRHFKRLSAHRLVLFFFSWTTALFFSVKTIWPACSRRTELTSGRGGAFSSHILPSGDDGGEQEGVCGRGHRLERNTTPVECDCCSRETSADRAKLTSTQLRLSKLLLD